jgi:hypothetical protein
LNLDVTFLPEINANHNQFNPISYRITELTVGLIPLKEAVRECMELAYNCDHRVAVKPLQHPAFCSPDATLLKVMVVLL